jgi:VWFA-related protein
MPGASVRRAIASLAGALLVAAGAAAQEGGSQEPASREIADQRFEETTSIYVVEVPVTVLVKGDPVRGLTREDFEILDDGEPREITTFAVVDVTSGAPVDTAVDTAGSESSGGSSAGASSATSPGASREVGATGRNYLLLFDFAYGGLGIVDARRRLLDSLEAAQELVESRLAPGDRVAVSYYSPLRGFKQMNRFTTDRAIALFALHGIDLILNAKPKLVEEEFAGWSELGPDLPGRRARTPLGPNRASLDDLVTEAAIWVQRGDPFLWHGLIIKHLAWGLREFTEEHADLGGSNYIVLFSRGPLYGDEETRSLFYFQELFRDLREENWPIQAVDTGGPGFGRDSLLLLAAETGGSLHTNSRDLKLLLEEVVEETQVSYILGFQVADLPEDGSYHKLQVRLVDGPKRARLTHRPGYYAPGAIDPLWRRSMAPAGAERSTEFAALTGLDPVYLTQGREVEGREDLYLVRDGFRYEFADERTLDRFVNDPRPYTIRNDGNCPVLEGIQGDPDVYYVLDGEIYIFSTPSAQRKFRNHPERYVEGYVPPADGP